MPCVGMESSWQPPPSRHLPGEGRIQEIGAIGRIGHGSVRAFDRRAAPMYRDHLVGAVQDAKFGLAAFF